MHILDFYNYNYTCDCCGKVIAQDTSYLASSEYYAVCNVCAPDYSVVFSIVDVEFLLIKKGSKCYLPVKPYNNPWAGLVTVPLVGLCYDYRDPEVTNHTA